MITLLLIYLAVPVTIFIVLRALKVRSKKLVIGIPLAIACLPFLLGVALYGARQPIQQGKFLANLGPLLSLAFPPPDLYQTLAEEKLSSDKMVYTLKVSHKYVGNHGISITIPASIPVGSGVEKDAIEISSRFFSGSKMILEKPKEKAMRHFWGTSTYGFHFNDYVVPTEVPTYEQLLVEVTVHGNFKKFLDQNKMAIITVSKFSDQ